MMDRRSFLRGALFVAAAPAIIRVSSLMKLPVPEPLFIPPYSWREIVAMANIDTGTDYGRSPAIDALDDMRAIQANEIFDQMIWAEARADGLLVATNTSIWKIAA